MRYGELDALDNSIDLGCPTVRCDDEIGYLMGRHGTSKRLFEVLDGFLETSKQPTVDRPQRPTVVDVVLRHRLELEVRQTVFEGGWFGQSRP